MFYNTNPATNGGDLILSSDLLFPGQPLGLFATGDIIGGNGITIRAADIIAIAGANLLAGPPDIVQPPGAPSNDIITIGTGSSATGGDIDFSNIALIQSTGQTQLVARDVTGNKARVFVGSVTNNAQIDVGELNILTEHNSGGLAVFTRDVFGPGNGISIVNATLKNNAQDVSTFTFLGDAPFQISFGPPPSVVGSISGNDVPGGWRDGDIQTGNLGSITRPVLGSVYIHTDKSGPPAADVTTGDIVVKCQGCFSSSQVNVFGDHIQLGRIFVIDPGCPAPPPPPDPQTPSHHTTIQASSPSTAQELNIPAGVYGPTQHLVNTTIGSTSGGSSGGTSGGGSSGGSGGGSSGGSGGGSGGSGGGSSGGSSGGNSGGNTGGNTGGNPGGSIGGSTGDDLQLGDGKTPTDVTPPGGPGDINSEDQLSEWKDRVPRRPSETYDAWESRVKQAMTHFASGEYAKLMENLRPNRYNDELGDVINTLKAAWGDEWDNLSQTDKQRLIDQEEQARLEEALADLWQVSDDHDLPVCHSCLVPKGKKETLGEAERNRRAAEDKIRRDFPVDAKKHPLEVFSSGLFYHFPDRQAALDDWKNTIWKISVESHREYAALLFERPDGTWGYTPSIRGTMRDGVMKDTPATSNPSLSEKYLPPGAVVQADLHTHDGASEVNDVHVEHERFDYIFDSEHLSDADQERGEEREINQIMLAPSGQMTEYVPGFQRYNGEWIAGRTVPLGQVSDPGNGRKWR